MAILQGLAELGRERWTAVSYRQQVNDPESTVRRLCSFCDVSPDAILGRLDSSGTKLSRYTLTRPEENKWHRNATAMRAYIPDLAETVEYIRRAAPELPQDEFDLDIDPAIFAAREITGLDDAPGDAQAGRRNARCHCGSGKRFKHCHGAPKSSGLTP